MTMTVQTTPPAVGAAEERAALRGALRILGFSSVQELVDGARKLRQSMRALDGAVTEYDRAHTASGGAIRMGEQFLTATKLRRASSIAAARLVGVALLAQGIGELTWDELQSIAEDVHVGVVSDDFHGRMGAVRIL